MFILTLEHCDRNHLGEMVCLAGVLAGDVGACMLPDDRLAIDGDDGFGLTVGDLCFVVDDQLLPRVVAVVGASIM